MWEICPLLILREDSVNAGSGPAASAFCKPNKLIPFVGRNTYLKRKAEVGGPFPLRHQA